MSNIIQLLNNNSGIIEFFSLIITVIGLFLSARIILKKIKITQKSGNNSEQYQAVENSSIKINK